MTSWITGRNPSTRLNVKGFDNIRRIQKFIRSQALSHGVPVIPNYSLDQAIAAVLDLVVERATQYVPDVASSAEGERRGSLGEASVEAVVVDGDHEESAGAEPVAQSKGSTT